MTETHAAGEARRYQFFNHAACEFYPCHDMPAEELNCLFCFCPLYTLGPACGGNFTYVGENRDIKDCSSCTVPHRHENYDYLMSRYAEIQRLAAPPAPAAREAEPGSAVGTLTSAPGSAASSSTPAPDAQ